MILKKKYTEENIDIHFTHTNGVEYIFSHIHDDGSVTIKTNRYNNNHLVCYKMVDLFISSINISKPNEFHSYRLISQSKYNYQNINLNNLLLICDIVSRHYIVNSRTIRYRSNVYSMVKLGSATVQFYIDNEFISLFRYDPNIDQESLLLYCIVNHIDNKFKLYGPVGETYDI